MSTHEWLTRLSDTPVSPACPPAPPLAQPLPQPLSSPVPPLLSALRPAADLQRDFSPLTGDAWLGLSGRIHSLGGGVGARA